MIVISNHVRTLGLNIPENAVVRINVAWVQNAKELVNIIEDNKDRVVWLDYPTGRTKPPKPVLSLADSIDFCKKYNNIKYFAFSNAEDVNIVELIRNNVPKDIKLIPKIETVAGIHNLVKICKSAKTDVIMLDKEDLYISVGGSNEEFNDLVNLATSTCKNNNIKCLTLKGVVFSEMF